MNNRYISEFPNYMLIILLTNIPYNLIGLDQDDYHYQTLQVYHVL